MRNFSKWIIEETSDYIIINKPPLLSSLEDRKTGHDILTLARDYLPEAKVCHRLDKETSGVMVLSKNDEAYRNLSIQFEKREVLKVYHAIAEGIPAKKKFSVDKKLLKKGSEVIVHPDGKPSQTSMEVLEVYKKHTLVECLPKTGRMHQLRVHLAYAGHPIIHDSLYGGKPLLLSSIKPKYNLKKWTEEEPVSKRIALHACSISFKDLMGNMTKYESPYPKDFKALVNQLGKNK